MREVLSDRKRQIVVRTGHKIPVLPRTEPDVIQEFKLTTSGRVLVGKGLSQNFLFGVVHLSHVRGRDPRFVRQQTTGAAFAENKPVAVIRRSAPLQYVQFDAFQLDERVIPNTKVKYTNKKGKVVTVPLVEKYAVIMVEAFSNRVSGGPSIP